MSYYYKHNYTMSDHAIQRCKERIENLKDFDNFQVKDEVMKLISKSTNSFEIGDNLYLSAGNTQIYFVIDKRTNSIITATKISAEKQLRMVLAEENNK